MNRSIVTFFLGAVLVLSPFLTAQKVYAQGFTLPAEMNQGFTPISIPAGGVSRLRVSIFNPNSFALTNATWTYNLIREQPGLVIANPMGIVNTCGGSVTAVAGSTTFSLSGGTVPAQTGATPGSCTVTINITSTTVGTLITTIPAGALTASGGGTTITNTDPASATLHVGGAPPPSIRKSFSASTIWVGEISRLSIVISNNDSSTTLTQASLTDDLPAGVFLANPVSPSLSGCGTSARLNATSGGRSLTLSNASIAPNSTCTITVNVTSNAQGEYTNSIPANSLQTQQGLTNVTEAITRLHVQEVGVSKRFSPGSLPAGGTTTLTITLQNPTGSPYTGVNVSDTLPAPLTVARVLSNTCGGTVSTTTDTIRLSGGTIPPGNPANPGTCSIAVEVSVPAGTSAGTFRNTIPPGELTTNEGVGNLRPGTARVVVTSTDVVGQKSFSPSTISAGGNARLRIDVFAPSDIDLTNVTITDDLPPGVTVSNSQPPSITGCGTTPPLVFTAPTGATSILLSGGSIRAGERCRIQLYVTSSIVGLHTNIISAANITNNENRTLTDDLTASLTVTGEGSQSIAMVKAFNPLTVFGGSASTMSIELINQSTVRLTGIRFTDNMPDGMILANPVNFNVGTCGGLLKGTPGTSSFTFEGGRLRAGASCVLTLGVTITVNGNLTNTIPAGAVTTDNGLINADPAEATLTNLPGVSISKYFQSNPTTVNSSSALLITIQNTGNIPLNGLGFSDTLPSGLAIAGDPAPATANNCGGTLTAEAGTRLIQLTNGMLGPTSSCTIVVHVMGSARGSYRNTIPPGSIVTDEDVTNSLPTTDTLVIGRNRDNDNGGGGGVSPAPVGSGFLIPVTGFAPRRVTNLDLASRPRYDATALTLEIPVLKVKSSIVGVDMKNDRWDVSWLQDQVGWLNGTAFPTWTGNSLLTAHAIGADGKPSVFFRLKNLGVGEYIFVYSSGYRHTYQVVTNQIVEPDDASVIKHEEKSVLTLITCDNFDEKTGTYLQRVAVRAILVDVRPVRE